MNSVLNRTIFNQFLATIGKNDKSKMNLLNITKNGTIQLTAKNTRNMVLKHLLIINSIITKKKLTIFFESLY